LSRVSGKTQKGRRSSPSWKFGVPQGGKGSNQVEGKASEMVESMKKGPLRKNRIKADKRGVHSSAKII